MNRKQRRAAKKNASLRVVGNGTNPAVSAEILPLLNRAVKLQHAGDFEGAKEIYESVLPTHAEDLNFCLCLADFFDLQGDLDQAYTQYKKAVTLQPGNAICWSRLSVCLKKRSDLKASIIACRKAIELEPNDANLLAHLATLLELTYDPKGAGKALQAALKLDPENFVIHQALGDTQTYLGRFDEAAGSYR
ncbi:MAG: tetratricopeptide repeat protein, partial [Fimbriimonadaceae bacterium]|nr:tetratricopeptide repeat protein [Alphaproteobacteria bacterium]